MAQAVVTVTGAQIRAARALLGWSQADLAEASGLALSSVKNVEGELTDPVPRTVVALRKALEAAGVLLLGPGDVHDGGYGVRLKAAKQRRIEAGR